MEDLGVNFKKELSSTFYNIFVQSVESLNKLILKTLREYGGLRPLNTFVSNISIARAMRDYYRACGFEARLYEVEKGCRYRLQLEFKDWYENS